MNWIKRTAIIALQYVFDFFGLSLYRKADEVRMRRAVEELTNYVRHSGALNSPPYHRCRDRLERLVGEIHGTYYDAMLVSSLLDEQHDTYTLVFN